MKHPRFLRRTALIAAGVIILSASVPAHGASYPCEGYVALSTGMLQSASASSGLIGSVTAGDSLYITGETGAYYIVYYQGQQGYVLKTAVTLGDNDPNVPTENLSGAYQTLGSGSSGVQVKELQLALKELSFLSGTADGKYGSATQKAVSDFQTKNGLTATGVADVATQEKLFEGQSKNRSGKTVTVSTASSAEGAPIFQGKEGDAVKRLQQALKDLGYYSNSCDGKCGSLTVSAIRAFQKKNGLDATGTADKATLALLYSGTALSAKATVPPKATATPKPTAVPTASPQKAVYPFFTVTTAAVNLRKGASTSSSRILTVPAGAVITVQAMKGDFLQVTYAKGGKTYSGYLMTQYAEVPAVYLGGRELPMDAAARERYTTLQIGCTGSAVTALQTALSELGYYTGVLTGAYDTFTLQAVKAFQKKNDLLQNGAVTPEEQQLIFENKPLSTKGKKTAVAVLPPFDDADMAEGDTGYQVSLLQTRLQALGHYSGDITGVFDAATRKAVMAFQTRYLLTADGKVGLKTRTALSALFATPTPVPNYAVPTATPEPLTEENCIILRSGTRGLAVSDAQARLAALGYYDVPIVVDGIYDSDDIAAVKAFQKKHNLKADGVAGFDTQSLLYSDAAQPAWATATPKPTATPAPVTAVPDPGVTPAPTPALNVTLKLGSSGTQVKQLQEALKTLGFYTGKINSSFDNATRLAVASFQKENKLTVDGIAGKKTLTRLYSGTAVAAPTATPKPTAIPKVKATATPKPGTVLGTAALRLKDTGTRVKQLQQALITLGYLPKGSDDGIFGPKTYNAVRAFQKAGRLTVDGIAGKITLAGIEKALSGAPIAPATATPRPTATPKPTATPVPTAVPPAAFTAPTAHQVRFANWYT